MLLGRVLRGEEWVGDYIHRSDSNCQRERERVREIIECILGKDLHFMRGSWHFADANRGVFVP